MEQQFRDPYTDFIWPIGPSYRFIYKFWEVNSAMFVCVTGNALQISEDLVRRFMVCELDARCENPELRPFQNDLLADVKKRRSIC